MTERAEWYTIAYKKAWKIQSEKYLDVELEILTAYERGKHEKEQI